MHHEFTHVFDVYFEHISTDGPIEVKGIYYICTPGRHRGRGETSAAHLTLKVGVKVHGLSTLPRCMNQPVPSKQDIGHVFRDGPDILE
jgi:hypothetical protein